MSDPNLLTVQSESPNKLKSGVLVSRTKMKVSDKVHRILENKLGGFMGNKLHFSHDAWNKLSEGEQESEFSKAWEKITGNRIEIQGRSNQEMLQFLYEAFMDGVGQYTKELDGKPSIILDEVTTKKFKAYNSPQNRTGNREVDNCIYDIRSKSVYRWITDFEKKKITESQLREVRKHSTCPSISRKYGAVNCLMASAIAIKRLEKTGIKCEFCKMPGHIATIVTLENNDVYYVDFLNDRCMPIKKEWINTNGEINMKLLNLESMSSNEKYAGKVTSVQVISQGKNIMDVVLGNLLVLEQDANKTRDIQHSLTQGLEKDFYKDNPGFFRSLQHFRSRLFPHPQH